MNCATLLTNSTLSCSVSTSIGRSAPGSYLTTQNYHNVHEHGCTSNNLRTSHFKISETSGKFGERKFSIDIRRG